MKKKFTKIYNYLKNDNRDYFIQYFNDNKETFLYDKILEISPDILLKKVSLPKYYDGCSNSTIQLQFSGNGVNDNYINIIVKENKWSEKFELEYNLNSRYFELEWDSKKLFDEKLNSFFIAFNRIKIIKEIENEKH